MIKRLWDDDGPGDDPDVALFNHYYCQMAAHIAAYWLAAKHSLSFRRD